MPGPKDILKALGDNKKQVSGNKGTGEGATTLPVLQEPAGLLDCPVCHTYNRKYAQERYTGLPGVSCTCGTKATLDISPTTGQPTAIAWNRRHNPEVADQETIRWLTIIDMNMRNERNEVMKEDSYDPYIHSMITGLFEALIDRKTNLDKKRIMCPFCGDPDFLDMHAHLQCANSECGAIIPFDYFDALVRGNDPAVVFAQKLQTQQQEKPEPEVNPGEPTSQDKIQNHIALVPQATTKKATTMTAKKTATKTKKTKSKPKARTSK